MLLHGSEMCVANKAPLVLVPNSLAELISALILLAICQILELTSCFVLCESLSNYNPRASNLFRSLHTAHAKKVSTSRLRE